jgi:hypothetical protein
MAKVLLSAGDKVHVVERRRFETDVRRHFLAVVDDVDGPVMKATGYAFVYDPRSLTFVRRAERRTRLMSMASAGFIIHVLPATADVEGAEYQADAGGRLVLTDGVSFSLDINEFGPDR